MLVEYDPEWPRLFARAADTRVTVGPSELTVHHRGRGFATSWHLHHALSWSDVASLHLDTGVHDSIVSLHAVTGADRQRRTIVDARALTRDEWHDLADAVRQTTDGRIQLDLRPLDDARPRDN